MSPNHVTPTSAADSEQHTSINTFINPRVTNLLISESDEDFYWLLFVVMETV